MTDAQDLVQEALFALANGDLALKGRITDAEGNFGWFQGGVPARFGLDENVAALTVDSETAAARGDTEQVTVTLSVLAQTHKLARAVAADLLRLFHPSGGRQWKPIALADGHAGYIRREFADWANDPGSELKRRNMRFRVLVARPRAA